MKMKLPKVNCSRGAPLGRPNILPIDTNRPIKLHLQKLEWVGDYDQGNCYWGNSAGTSIYWANHEEAELFVRASSRKMAKELVIKTLPNATFYR
jgi:hypothetical protein